MTSPSAATERQDPNQLLWEIESKMVDVFVEFGKYRNRISRDSAVLAFFYIHKTMTQTQLRELAEHYLRVRKLRGFSTGSISTLLNDMEKKKVITKRRDDVTNSLQYQILGSLRQINLSQIGILLLNRATLEELKNKIDQELKFIEINSPDRQNILHFTKELSDLIQVYQKIFDFYSSESEIPVKPTENLSKFVANFFKSIPDPTPTPEQVAIHKNEVSPRIIRVENLISNFFITRDRQLEIRSEVTSKVLAQFIVHRELTQERLRQLTGLSMGAVSQAVRILQNQEIIQTISTNDRSIHYQLRGLIHAFQTLTQAITDKLEESLTELERLSTKLSTVKTEFQKYPIYVNLVEFLQDLIDFFQLSIRFAKYWKKLSEL